MKKPYNEEKIGLRIEFNTIRILLIAFFLSEEIFSQIPINGFCQYKNFNIEQNFNCLLSLNYNDDSYSDLILYNPQLKKIVSISGEPIFRILLRKIRLSKGMLLQADKTLEQEYILSGRTVGRFCQVQLSLILILII